METVASATPKAMKPAAATGGSPADVARHFTCSEGDASKFWDVTVNGSELTVRFGRIGTRGQAQTKAFPSPEAARQEAEKLIRSKLGKGYLEQVGGK